MPRIAGLLAPGHVAVAQRGDDGDDGDDRSDRRVPERLSEQAADEGQQDHGEHGDATGHGAVLPADRGAALGRIDAKGSFCRLYREVVTQASAVRCRCPPSKTGIRISLPLRLRWEDTERSGAGCGRKHPHAR